VLRAEQRVCSGLAAGAECGIEVESIRRAADPAVATKRRAPLYAAAEGRHFRFGLRAIHELPPIPRPNDRPIGQPLVDRRGIPEIAVRVL
jgi:hypothetical protein